jgi:hypothetical protein
LSIPCLKCLEPEISIWDFRVAADHP